MKEAEWSLKEAKWSLTMAGEVWRWKRTRDETETETQTFSKGPLQSIKMTNFTDSNFSKLQHLILQPPYSFLRSLRLKHQFNAR